MSLIATVLSGLFVACVGIGTGPPSTVVLPNKATLQADGSVQLTMKVRCEDQQQAFEWSVEIARAPSSAATAPGRRPG